MEKKLSFMLVSLLIGCATTEPSTIVYDNPLSASNINSPNQDKLEKAHKLRKLGQNKDVKLLYEELDNAGFVNYYLYKIDNYSYTNDKVGKIPNTGCVVQGDIWRRSKPFEMLIEKDIRPYQFKNILCRMSLTGSIRNYVGGSAADRLIYKKDPLAVTLKAATSIWHYSQSLPGSNQLDLKRVMPYYDSDIQSAKGWDSEKALSNYEKVLDSLIIHAESNKGKISTFDGLYSMNMCVGDGLRSMKGQCTAYQNQIIQELKDKIDIRNFIAYVPTVLYNDGISQNIATLNKILPKIDLVISLYADSASIKRSIQDIRRKIKEYQNIMVQR